MLKPISTTFMLSKWYADVISLDGACYILYVAHLGWKRLNIGYTNVVHISQEGKVTSTIWLQRKLQINHQPNELIITGNKLNGSWSKRHPSINQLLFASAKGDIAWNCEFPLAEVRLTNNQYEIKGYGYAELLEMTLKPWQFGIDELYWGRFLGQQISIIWIEWKGPNPQQWLYCNGRAISSFQLTDTGLYFENNELQFIEPKPIRKGTLINTVFQSYKWLRALFPIKILLTNEQKWISKAMFSNDGQPLEGWSIYEKVVWKK